jgi:hypothetical protein
MLKRASVAILFLVLAPQTVHAFDHHEHHFHHDGGDDGGCGGSSSSTTAPSPAPSTHARVFVTSTTYSGALGGAEGADAECMRRAVTSGLSGQFRAWLSDASTGAFDRTADAGPWYTTNDALAFVSKADLRGAPRSELLDEYGGYPARAGGWSGSDAAGIATGDDCDGWTNAASDRTGSTGTLALGAAWGGGGAPLSCDVKAPLICFQQ